MIALDSPILRRVLDKYMGNKLVADQWQIETTT
jgi:hypothetical protein